MIRTIEEFSMNAWPALQTLLYDGWVLRFASGYTRRANSVNPIYPSTLPLEDKIRACEALYARQGLPACFKMTAESQPNGLDETLAARGYALDAPTSVQVLDLRAAQPEPSTQVEIAPAASVEWNAGFAQASGLAAQRRAIHEQMLAAILLPCAYAAVRQDGQLASFGLAVAQDGYVGFYDIVTGADQRRKGHARRLMLALLDWARQQGAHTAYLQVMLNNAPALDLYAGLGFREVYRYWYRVKGAEELRRAEMV
jgi:ribosomal protein S18 acetylase RimI-like enzyme